MLKWDFLFYSLYPLVPLSQSWFLLLETCSFRRIGGFSHLSTWTLLCTCRDKESEMHNLQLSDSCFPLALCLSWCFLSLEDFQKRQQRGSVALGQHWERRDKGKWNATTNCVCFPLKTSLPCPSGLQVESPRQMQPGNEPQMIRAGMSTFFPARNEGSASRERWDFPLGCTLVSGSVISEASNSLSFACICISLSCQPSISSSEHVNNNPLELLWIKQKHAKILNCSGKDFIFCYVKRCLQPGFNKGIT